VPSDQFTHARFRFQRGLRRRRRPLAAALAAAAVLLTVTALRSPSSVDVEPGAADTGAALRPGEVAVAVTLGSAAVATVLSTGQVVDIVGISEDGTASVVAPAARILELPPAGSTLSGSSAAVVLVAVPEAKALPLLGSAAASTMTLLIRDLPMSR
jgi:hypothetical protein